MSTATAAAPAADAGPVKKKKPMLLVIVLVLALAGGGGWYFLTGSSGEEAAAAPVVESGPVVDLEAMTLNLSDGRYLKIGLSLEVTEEAAHATEEGVNGAKARDAAISILGQSTYDEMLVPRSRAAAIKELSAEIEERYEGEVLHVYVTEFVMQ